jgi:TolB-like protein/tetratricopeptide (TPR) repeat protein
VAAGTLTRIAVLPLTSSAPSAAPYLADALTEQLIDTLGGLTSMRVTAAASSAKFKGSPASVDEIARQLGVDIVVTGVVTPEPTGPNEPVRARVETQVIRAGVATPLWSGPTEWVAGDTAGLRTGLARVIAGAVSAAVTSREAGRLSRRTQVNANAEEAYFRGRSELNGYGPDGARRALDLFAQAIRYDASFAAAHAWKSRAYVVLGQFGIISEGESRQSALTEAREALRLDADSADAHRAMADLMFFYDWDWAGAESEYLKALELNPSLSRARLTYAELLAVVHRFPDALTQSELARSLDSQSPEVISSQAIVQLYADRFDEARATIEQLLRAQPGSVGALIVRARVDAAQERYPEALEAVNRALTLSGGGVAVEITRIQLLARNGQADEARAALAALDARAATGAVRVSRRDRAYVRLALGDADGACGELEQSYADRESALRWVGVDPRVDALRGDPRFTAILARMHLP